LGFDRRRVRLEPLYQQTIAIRIMPNANSGAGTPPTPGLIFAADLGGTHLRTAAIDAHGRILFRLKQKTPHATTPDEIVDAVLLAVRKAQKEARPAGYSVTGISVVVPGTIDVAAGTIVKAPNLPALDDFGLATTLANELKLPAILENDANAAAVGELWQGAGRGHDTLLCVTLGTGVGGGIILNRKLWRGVDGSAGEIGHIGVDPFSGVPCPCGSQGCLEVFASATGIVRMTRESLDQYPDSVLKGAAVLTAEGIYCAGARGDELAIDVFRRMGTYLGIGLASLVNLFNPQLIVIAGGVINGWDLFAEHTRRLVNERAFHIPAASVKIVKAECGDDAGLLGAAKLAFDNWSR
jgi:glucokinase